MSKPPSKRGGGRGKAPTGKAGKPASKPGKSGPARSGKPAASKRPPWMPELPASPPAHGRPSASRANPPSSPRFDPHAQREAIRLAVIALEYQSEFRGGCDTKVWHPAPVTRSIRDIEREKKERAAKLRMKRAVLAASQMTGQGPRPIGQ